MLNQVKAALRIKTASFDDEVQGLIDACLADLRIVGIIIPEPPAEGIFPSVGDPLILRAVILYAKAHFGFSDNSEKYQKAYDYLKCALSLAGDYHALE
ncbi:MAG: DNA-packaging protein [Candidatus Fimivicinus sp.]|nr:DNA-packaging protein [Oscillospiraceae bacterium]MDY5590971.1 DNA-packaging protein [Candidatus Fimivicinus sp.]